MRTCISTTLPPAGRGRPKSEPTKVTARPLRTWPGRARRRTPAATSRRKRRWAAGVGAPHEPVLAIGDARRVHRDVDVGDVVARPRQEPRALVLVALEVHDADRARRVIREHRQPLDPAVVPRRRDVYELRAAVRPA